MVEIYNKLYSNPLKKEIFSDFNYQKLSNTIEFSLI